MTEWTTQDAFEKGIAIGLRAALTIVGEGDFRAKQIRQYIGEVEDATRRRQKHERGDLSGREAVLTDFIPSTPIAHAADFGLPPAHGETEAVASTHLRWVNRTAQGIEARMAIDAEGGVVVCDESRKSAQNTSGNSHAD